MMPMIRIDVLTKSSVYKEVTQEQLDKINELTEGIYGEEVIDIIEDVINDDIWDDALRPNEIVEVGWYETKAL